jgi:signal peptidase II
MDSKKNILIFSLLSILIILLDFITKLSFPRDKLLIIIPNVLEVNYTQNYGLIYGLFSGNIFFTLLIPFFILGILTYYLMRNIKNINILIALSLVIAGVIGNLISRIFYGYVIDGIYIPFLQPVFPTFNIADMSSLFGVLYLIYIMIKTK